MAVSTLAEIDWDNMTSAETTTAVRLLAVATQERFNIATVARDGSTRVRLLSPFGSFSATDWDIFPYKTNDPDYTFNDGDPVADFTTEVETLISDMITVYADVEKWDDADTDSETTTSLYLLGGAADDSGTYDNRLFELTEYTSYPDLSVNAPEEVKKWYDMISECQYIVRRSGAKPSVEPANDDYLIYDGLFDVEADAFLGVNQDGAEYFGGDETSAVGEPNADNTVYAAFKSGNDALFSTVPTQFDDSVDSGTFPPEEPRDEPVYNMRISRTSSGYFSWLRTWKVTYVADWADSITAIGFTGKPLSYKNQAKASHNVSTNSAFTPSYTFPASTTADNERYYTTNVVTQVGDKDKIAVDHLLSPVTVPANISAIANNDLLTADIDLVGSAGAANFSSDQFLEFWNGEGGFDSYTP